MVWLGHCGGNWLGDRFHATLRGNDRRAIFRQDTDRYRFLELVSELAEPFATRIDADVLMDNHAHPPLETLWERIVLAVERGKGEKWMQFRDRYGDWGRIGKKHAQEPTLQRAITRIEHEINKT